jgi:translation initiation factor 2D
LISSLITPYLPIYSPQQAQYYQIKKTGWKNVKKFIKYLEKERLVKSKDRNGQETIIVEVDFSDRRVEQFVPYKLPSKNAVENAGKPVSGKQKAGEDGADPSVGQTLNVQVLYRPTGKLTPTLFPALSHSDTKNYYKYSEVSSQLDNYLTSQVPPLVSEEHRRIVKVNPFLANTVFTSSSSDDTATLARGEVTRDGLLKRLISDPSLLAPFHAILKPNQTLADVRPKAGTAPKITVTIERRASNKTATRVSGVEVFGIVPSLLAEELQKKCASSTSVAQAVGAVKGIMEILIQGDQRNAVETALARRGVRSQWINVVDKAKKKK